jgi:hypothetical protein
MRRNLPANCLIDRIERGKPSIATSSTWIFFGKQRLVCFGFTKINYKLTALSSTVADFFEEKSARISGRLARRNTGKLPARL